MTNPMTAGLVLRCAVSPGETTLRDWENACWPGVEFRKCLREMVHKGKKVRFRYRVASFVWNGLPE